MKKQTVEETIIEGGRLRAPLRPLLETFSPLFSKRREIAEKFSSRFAQNGMTAALNCSTYPLLHHQSPDLSPFIREAAIELLPSLDSLAAISPARDKLERLFIEGADADLENLVSARLTEDREHLIAIANKYDLKPEFVVFASDFIVSAVLHGLSMTLSRDDFPDWRKGKCPVCGLPPIIAWLGRRPPVENNEFLASGGGKKHLHCGMCGTDWHFVRGICPACGEQGEDAMQILGEEDRRHERIDWCKKCNSYLPLIDLREMTYTPDMDAMALCLMHLDIAAAEKGLIPLKPSFWNMF